MEKWQCQHILDNLPDLIEMTQFDEIVLAFLLSERILSTGDTSSLEAIKKTGGRHEHSSRLYDLLTAREFAYEKLAKALFKTNQTGALKILLKGFTNEGIRTSLPQCGIPVELDDFENSSILAFGNRIKLTQYFPTVDTTALQKIFYETLPGHVYFEMFIQKKEFELFKNTIPAEPAFYVPRFISNRIKIKKDVFKSTCVDIFVFKGITRHELTQLAKPNLTATSEDLEDCITSRFIWLNRDEDWEEILQEAEHPVHLINYESTEDTFFLENTSGISEILLKFCSDQDRVYIREEEFVKQQLDANRNSRGVCICDTPGMGKTLLLGNLARSFAQQRPTTITAFIGLSRFLERAPRPLPNMDQQPKKALWYLLNYITATNEHTNVLTLLAEKGLVIMYLLFDGFDEITLPEVEWIKGIIDLIQTTFHVIDIYVTSRPHMRRELESSLKVMAYDISPFNLNNQVEFLVNCWLMENPDCNKSSLETYALRVLKMVKNTLSDTQQRIAGIPLLCGLIASVYAKKAKTCSFSDPTQEIRWSPRSICEMYGKFIKMKINNTIKSTAPSNDAARNKTTIDGKNLKTCLVGQAWKLLFSKENCFQKLESVENLNLDNSIILKVGIIQQRAIGNRMKMEFVHRTFAEFLVAEYLANYLLSSKVLNPKYDILFGFIFRKALESSKDWFLHNVVVYFLNSLLMKVSKLRSPFSGNQVALFLKRRTAGSIDSVLFACCRSSCNNILFLFKNILLSCSPNVRDQFKKYFTKQRFSRLLEAALTLLNFRGFKEMIQLIAEVFNHTVKEVCQMHTYSGETLLGNAVFDGKYEAVEFLIDKIDCKGQNMLELCVLDSYYDDRTPNKTPILKTLLDKDPKLVDECPNLLMTKVIHPEMLTALVTAGAPIESINPKYDSEANCVTFAATYMSPSDFHTFLEFLLCEEKAQHLFYNDAVMNMTLPFVIKTLSLLPETLERLLHIPGIDLNMIDTYGNNLAFNAVLRNSLTSLEMLIQLGTNYKYTGQYGRSLLHEAAAKNKNPEIIKYLISLLDVNRCDENGMTPIWLAARHSTLANVRILCDGGANIFFVNKNGRSILHAAASGGNLDVISYCVDYGLNIDLKDIQGNTPIFFAAHFSNVDTVKLLVKQGADYKITNKHLTNILHLAAKNGKIELAEYCVDLGIDLNIGNKFGDTPINLVCMRAPEKVKMIQTLVHLGADFRANNYGLNVLHLAAKYGQEELIRFLTGLDLDPNLQTKRGYTPIMIAMINKNLAVLPALFEAGATCDAVNNDGCNFLDLATKTQNIFIVEYCLNLVSGKCQPDFKGNISVLGSAYWNNLPTLLYLIRKGANCRHCNPEGQGVPYFATYRGNLQLLQYLKNVRLVSDQISSNGESMRHNLTLDGWLANFKQLVRIGVNQKIINSTGGNLLHTAARTNSVELFHYLLTEGFSVNQQDVNGDTPIMMASLFGDSHSVQTFVETGADYNLTNANGHNIFHIACHRSNEKIILFCMNIGMDPNLADIYGNTPFLLAAQSCSPQLIRQMINFKADLTIMNHESQTILHMAARYGNFNLIKLCVELRFDLNQRDKNGDPPIFLAFKHAHNITVLKLLDHGADLYATNNQGKHILHALTVKQCSALFNSLISVGLDVNRCDEDGRTLIWFAAMYSTLASVISLNEQGADLFVLDKNGMSILHAAAFGGNLDVISYCVDYGLNVDLRDMNEDSPIFLAASFSSVDTVKRLVQEKANFNLTNKFGANILHSAAVEGNIEIAEYCIKLGIDPNSGDTDGDTPLMYAVMIPPEYEMINTLRNLNADCTMTNNNGRNILHYASEYGDEKLLNFCIDLGLDPNQQTSDGLRPIEIAVMNENLAVIPALIKAGAKCDFVTKRGQNILHVATKTKNLKVVKYCLTLIPDINQQDYRGCTPVIWSACLNDLPTIRYLIEKGADLHVLNNNGMSVLHYAALRGHAKVILYCVDNGLNIDLKDIEGNSPILFAAACSYADAVKLLVAQGANYNVTNKLGKNILHFAAAGGNIELAKYCITQGINPNSRDITGLTPLMYAVMMPPKYELIHTLLKHRADCTITDNNGSNVLHLAAKYGDEKLLNIWIEYALDPNQQTKDGTSPLQIAVINENLAVIPALIKAGAKCHFVNKHGQNILHVATRTKSMKLIKYCLSLELDINQQDDGGFTPLFYSARLNDLAAVRYLIKNGADLHVLDNNGRSILHFAVSSGYLDVISYCVENGLNIDLKDIKGSSPILLAAEASQIDTVNFLVKQGANFNTTNERGRNILHFAARRNIELAEYCITLGIDPNSRDRDGNTALMHAVMMPRKHEMILTLIKSKADYTITNNTGSNILHLSAEYGDEKLLNYCIELGLDPNQRTTDGFAPIQIAVMRENLDVIPALVDRGADGNMVNKLGQNILHIATEMSNLKVVKYCLSLVPDINQQDYYGQTPVFCSACLNDLPTVRFLIERGADLNVLDNKGRSILHYAAAKGYLDIISYCVDYGLNVDLKDMEEDSPILMAASFSNEDTVNILVEKGANFILTNKFGANILHLAALKGNIEIAEYCIKLGIDPNSGDADGDTPLMYAVMMPPEYEMINTLRNLNADCTMTNNYGRNILHYASEYGDEKLLNFCIDLGLDPNQQTLDGLCPIEIAVMIENLDAMPALIKAGAKCEFVNKHGQNILHIATEMSNLKIVKYCLSLVHDINQQDYYGQTPVFCSACLNDIPTVRYLIEKGADLLVLDKKGRSILHYVAVDGSLDAISYCIDNGLNVDLKDLEGDSPILLAAAVSNVGTVKLLVKHGANFNLPNKFGANILHLAASQGSIEIVEYCIKLGIDPNCRDTDGRTPMMYAAKFEMINTLKNLEADYTIADNDGRNLLHHAARHGDKKLVNFCIEVGLDPNQQTTDGTSPIEIAVMHENLSVVPILVEGGADCNFVNKSGQNILHLATRMMNLKIVEYCLNLVSNKNQQDYDGYTPIILSACFNDLATVKYLIEKGADYSLSYHAGYDVPSIAIKTENFELLQCLQNFGWDPNQMSRNGESRVFTLATEGCLAKLKLLHQIGTNLKITNSSGENLLHTAARTNSIELLRYLLTEGLPVNQQDDNGYTPIMLAALFGDIQSVWTILESGADYNLSNMNGQNIFHNATRRANEKLIMFCMYIGMDPNQGDIYGNTPFLLAAQSCSLQMIKRMIHCGADPTMTNNESQTILHIAARNANFHLIEMFIELGFDSNQRETNGDSAIFLAVKYADINTVLCLEANGADSYATNSQGQTILHIAAERGNVGLVNYCLVRGLNPNQKDNEGDTPLFLAAEYGDVGIVHMLITYGADYNSVNKDGQNILYVAADWLNENLVSYCVNVLFIGKEKPLISPYQMFHTQFRPPSDKKLRVVLKSKNFTQICS